MTKSLDHTCTMFCDCPIAQAVAGGTGALRSGPPSGTAPSSVRQAKQRAEDTHRSATKYGGR